MGWLWALPRPFAREMQQQHRRACPRWCALAAMVVASLPAGTHGAALRATSISYAPNVSGLLGGAFADGATAFLQSTAAYGAGQPASYWAGAPTPAPPSLGPGPYPNMMWVEITPMPLPDTTPPVYEQCHGCYCMFVFPDKFVSGDTMANEYTCIGGAATHRVPSIKWVGQPGQDISKQDGSKCPTCASFAVTVEDLDFPNGVGEVNNHVESIFWAVNIPGDWTNIDDTNAFADKSGVVVGYNSQGGQGLMQPCPVKGTHRYKVTLWSISAYLGSEMDPYNDRTPAATVKGDLESRELARATFYTKVVSPGYEQAKAFLSR